MIEQQISVGQALTAFSVFGGIIGILVGIIFNNMILARFKSHSDRIDKANTKNGELEKEQNLIKFNYIDRFNKLEKINSDNHSEVKEFISFKIGEIKDDLKENSHKVETIFKEHNEMKKRCFELNLNKGT